MTAYYLAGRFSRKDELAGYAAQIEAAGEYVTSRWLTGAHDATTERELTHRELSGFALDDMSDIYRADTFILFTESPDVGYTSGGRMAELGYALSLGGHVVRTIVVGPYENVFTRLVLERYDTWGELAAAKGWAS